VKQALTAKAPAPEPKPTRRKREDETRGGLMMAARRFARRIAERQFRKLADALREPAAPSILDNLFAPRPHDPEQERAYAEHVLRMQLDEWTQDSEQQQDEVFHYGRTVGFDHHP
jgi:hypothetical protein